MGEWTFLDDGLTAALVHFKSLHLMTDDLVMMTYWKVMKVMMHIVRMSKQ